MDVPQDLSKSFVFQSPEIDQLACALAKAQGDMEHAKKTETNNHLHSSYANLADVIRCLRKPFKDNGLSHSQLITMFGTGEEVVITKLMHESGQFLQSVLAIKTYDAKGINELQQFGSAITYLRRYALMGITGLASEDDDATGAKRKENLSNRSQGGSQNNKPASQGNASKGAPPATQGTPSASSAPPAGSDNTTQDGLPTLGGVTYNQVNGEIHAIGKATYDHKDLLKACGFSFRSADKVWFKKAA